MVWAWKEKKRSVCHKNTEDGYQVGGKEEDNEEVYKFNEGANAGAWCDRGRGTAEGEGEMDMDDWLR